jgi:tetratricopeptide (TPR) repeat protein
MSELVLKISFLSQRLHLLILPLILVAGLAPAHSASPFPGGLTVPPEGGAQATASPATPNAQSTGDLVITPSSIALPVGESHALRVTDKDGYPIPAPTWKVENPAIARIETQGTASVVGLSPGRTTIIATWQGRTGESKIHILGGLNPNSEPSAPQASGQGSASIGEHGGGTLQLSKSAPAGLSGDADSHYQRGLQLFDAGDIQGAYSEFSTVVSLRPDFAKAKTKLAYTLWKGGATAQAITTAQEALRLDPKDPEAEKTIGLALVDQGDLDGAMQHYKRAIRIDPSYVDPHIDLAIVFGKQGNHGRAIAEYEEALRLNPDSQKAHYNVAIEYHDLGNFPAAVEHNREAVRLAPDDPTALINLADTLRDTHDYDGSQKYYLQAIEIAPDIFEAHYGLCQTLIRKADYQGAVEEGKKAVQLDPEDPDAWCNLGIALSSLGERDEALKAYTRAHEIAPADPRILKRYQDALGGPNP